MRLLPIASGSSGNCIYVGNDNTHLLIDVGISKKRIEEGLNSIDLTLSDINGILITHEHSDHIKGLGVVLRKEEIPVYSANATIEAILNEGKTGKINEELFCSIDADRPFVINDITVNPFEIFHDAADPYAYVVGDGCSKVAVATDMGHFDEYIVENLRDLDGLLIEANHDIRMLQTGRYPYYLKQRILGARGHLCNEMCGQLLDRVISNKMKNIFLGHLSHENNYPDLAYESVRTEINLSDSEFRADDFDIRVARRDMPSGVVVL